MIVEMKEIVRKIARAMAGLPIIGRVVRIGVAIIRLPETRALLLQLDGRQSELDGRQERFETTQLPTLLQELTDLSRRQLERDNDLGNLVKSVPIALRKITRELIAVQDRLQEMPRLLEQKIEEVRDSVIPEMSRSLEQKIEEARESVIPRLEEAFGSINYLMGRVEFVRRELMFEMRYGATAPSTEDSQINARSEIISPEKLAAARVEGLRLNLGCGHVPVDGYLNVDRRALPGVDIVAEVDVLPFGQGEVNEIFSAHLLEHFPQEQLRRELLPYWVSLLKSGGILRSVVPDAESMIKGYADGSYPYSSLREVTFGAQDYDGDFHFNMFVTGQMEDLLREAGLSDVEWMAKGRRNGACFEMEFKAVKA